MLQGLTTADGLAAALDAAGGSWAELSRKTSVPVSTLKSRGDRLGVSRATSRSEPGLDDDERELLNDWEDSDDELDNEPILSQKDFDAIEEWVRSNVHCLLHDAPAWIQKVMAHKEEDEEDVTEEMAEAIICAKTLQRLVELVYSTHGVPLEMLWWLEAQEANRSAASVDPAQHRDESDPSGILAAPAT
jgi:hypothetical protein